MKWLSNQPAAINIAFRGAAMSMHVRQTTSCQIGQGLTGMQTVATTQCTSMTYFYPRLLPAPRAL